MLRQSKILIHCKEVAERSPLSLYIEVVNV